MANSFKVPMGFVEHLRLHMARGRLAINLTHLARSLDCSSGTLSKWVNNLIEVNIINRSSDRGPDGFEYWFTDHYKEEMRSDNWQRNLVRALQVHIAGSSDLTVKQRFDMANGIYRNVQKAIEKEIEEFNERIYEKNKLIEELKKENADKDSQISGLLLKNREIEAANREAVTSLNLLERQFALLKQERDNLEGQVANNFVNSLR